MAFTVCVTIGMPANRPTVSVDVKNLSLPNGELGGLPYYTGFNSFVCNQKHLDAAKIQPPATWE